MNCFDFLFLCHLISDFFLVISHFLVFFVFHKTIPSQIGFIEWNLIIKAIERTWRRNSVFKSWFISFLWFRFFLINVVSPTCIAFGWFYQVVFLNSLINSMTKNIFGAETAKILNLPQYLKKNIIENTLFPVLMDVENMF